MKPVEQNATIAPGDESGQAFEKPSKSERKRNMHRLQDLAESLASLNPAQLSKAPISEHMLLSVKEYQSIRAHEGKRRQGQYLGKVMRDEDSQAITDYILDLEKRGQIKKGTLDIGKKYK